MLNTEIKGMVITGRSQDLPTTEPIVTTLEDFVNSLMLTHSELSPIVTGVDDPRVGTDTHYLKLSYQFPMGDWTLQVSVEKNYKANTLMLCLRRRMFAMGSILSLDTPLPYRDILSKLSDAERLLLLKWIIADNTKPRLIKVFGSDIDIGTRADFTDERYPSLHVDIKTKDHIHSFVITDAAEHIRIRNALS